MKKLIFLLPILLVCSCEDLEVKPKNGANAAFVFTDGDVYRQYLAKIYASLSLTGQNGPAGDGDLTIITDEGFTSYIRAYWKAQELTTDEAVIAWNDAGIQDLNTLSWSSENQFVRVLYYRIFFMVSLVNDFLRQSGPSALADYGIPEEDFDEIEVMRAEARFLRALGYWHALDLFRKVPLVTTISTDIPSQVEPDVLFDFIETELSEIESVMRGPRQNEYGRADQAALWMLQAKLFINASVYMGQDRFADALTVVSKVIDQGGYALNTNYRTLFMADNHTSTELIFTLPADGVNSQSWGSTTFLVHAAIGGDLMVADNWGVDGGWAGLRTTSVFVDKFSDISGNTDSRAVFFTDGQDIAINDLRTFTDGYAVPKYSNLNSDGSPGSDVTHVDTDYPMFRLGDAYLMYAELFLRGAGGDQATAVGYINELRERAYGDISGNITGTDLTLDFILDERSRELHWEATRRIDLIRFGAFDDGIWPWKGGVAEGTTTESHLQFFPIPASELTANPKMEQNDPNY